METCVMSYHHLLYAPSDYNVKPIAVKQALIALINT